jgi:hypothetical protein
MARSQNENQKSEENNLLMRNYSKNCSKINWNAWKSKLERDLQTMKY